MRRLILGSYYYGFDSIDGEWSDEHGIICFRNENNNILNLALDDLSSKYDLVTDPNEDDMLNIASEYFSEYQSSFELFK